MPQKKIIFLSQDRFSTRNFKRFGIKQLIKRGFQVEFWECSPIIVPKFFKSFSPPDPKEFSGLKLFHSKKDLFEAIDELTAQDVILNLLAYHPNKTWDILKKISEKNINWGVFCVSDPFNPQNFEIGIKIKRLFQNPSSIFNPILKRFHQNWNPLRPYDFILKVGSAPISQIYQNQMDSNTEILDIHSFDYDLHLESKNEIDLEEAIVYLDEGGPFHPDAIISQNKFPCTQEEFYGSLNSFFRTTESKFESKVVIAAHPKSKYGKMQDVFERRKVVYKQSHRLAKSSKFVIATCSTSLHFAVIYKKPIIFLAYNPPTKNIFDHQVRCLAAMFDKTPIHWTGKESLNWKSELDVNEKLYSKFFTTYIKKPGSPEKPLWDIFADYFANN